MKSMKYSLFIPHEILTHPDLDSTEKIIYSEILFLSKKEGFCWCSNAFFADKYGISERHVRTILQKLKSLSLINVQMESSPENPTGRKIFPLLIPRRKKESKDRNYKSGEGTELEGRNYRSGNYRDLKISKKRVGQKEINKFISSSDSVPEPEILSFNSPEKMSAIQELDYQTRWQQVLKLWPTTETPPILAQAYKKFRKQETEHIQKVITFLETLSEDQRAALKTQWIVTYLKEGLFDPESILAGITSRLTNLTDQKSKITSAPPSKTFDVNPDTFMKPAYRKTF